MQKVVQRRLAAERQAVRRAAKQTGKADNAKEWSARLQQQSRNKQAAIYFQDEKDRRRREYETGPNLAPRRDTGFLKEQYGTVDPNVIHFPKLHWTQYNHFKSPFAQGDRVLIVKGKDVGRVGVVNEVSTESGFLRIADLRRVRLPTSNTPALPHDPTD
jgi:large subunit ribosomal protein L24